MILSLSRDLKIYYAQEIYDYVTLQSDYAESRSKSNSNINKAYSISKYWRGILCQVIINVASFANVIFFLISMLAVCKF